MTTAARSYRWIFWTLAIAGLALDQATKYELFRVLDDDCRGGRIVLIPDAFFVDVPTSLGGNGYPPNPEVPNDFLRPLRAYSSTRMPTVNKGALFGIGQGQNLVFGVVSVIAAVVVLYWSMRPQSRRDPFLCVALGLILAGTLGNLYDRIVFDGVRDFLHWNKWFDWYVFNIADVCLVVGASMLVLEAFFAKPTSQPTEPDSAEALAAAIPKGNGLSASAAVDETAVASTTRE